MQNEKIMSFVEIWTRWWIWGELVLWFQVCCGFKCLL